MTEFDNIFNEVVEFHGEYKDDKRGYPVWFAFGLIFRAIQIIMLSIMNLYDERIHE